MAEQNYFVKSNYPRIPNDFYPTVDKRCVYSFLEHFQPRGLCVDPCAPQGSGIVDTLQACGYHAMGLPDAFKGFSAEWIVSNPPYSRQLVTVLLPGLGMIGKAAPEEKSLPLVDAIISAGIRAVELGTVRHAAYLLRSNFDFAKSRGDMFSECEYYCGEIKMRFRPRWKEYHKGDDGPIHNFSWHIWSRFPKYSPAFQGPKKWWSDGVAPAGVGQ